jgi:hypothetical protein
MSHSEIISVVDKINAKMYEQIAPKFAEHDLYLFYRTNSVFSAITLGEFFLWDDSGKNDPSFDNEEELYDFVKGKIYEIRDQLNLLEL